jgi:hypothetical protein
VNPPTVVSCRSREGIPQKQRASLKEIYYSGIASDVETGDDFAVVLFVARCYPSLLPSASNAGIFPQ